VAKNLDSAHIRPVLNSKRFVTYPANLCPLLCGGEFAEFGKDFGEPVHQTIEDGQ
jgi:hypothetical protein